MNCDTRSRISPVVRAVLAAAIAGAGLTNVSFAQSDSSMQQTRDAYKEYVQIRKTAAEEASKWKEEKAALEDILKVLAEEKLQLEQQIETVKDSATTADSKRAELRDQLEEAKKIAAKYGSIAADMEIKLKSQLPYLPEPLVAQLRPLLARMPEDPKRTSMSYSQRMQNLVAMLSQIDRWNSTPNLISEISSLDGGAREVKTLYFGLGIAYFADSSGAYAGYGTPTADGWKWETVSGETAINITNALAMYQATKPAAFVTVPVKVN